MAVAVTDTAPSNTGIWSNYAVLENDGMPIFVGVCNGDAVVDAVDLEGACAAGLLADVLAVTGSIAGDLEGDEEVNFGDFVALAANFGQNVGYRRATSTAMAR